MTKKQLKKLKQKQNKAATSVKPSETPVKAEVKTHMSQVLF